MSACSWHGRCWLLSALLVSGCGGSHASVEGQVKLDDAVVETGSILFEPIEGTVGPSGRASIVKGRYAIDATGQLSPGTYRVEIRAPRKTGKSIPARSPAPRGTMIEEEVEAVPERYNTKSTLRQELKKGTNTADFALTTK
jgi:hypothetical protein